MAAGPRALMVAALAACAHPRPPVIATRPSPLDAIDPRSPLFDGKQVVFLGEPDHWIHEKYEYRLAFIRPLVARGFRWIGMEMGRSDAARIDHYLASGDERWLARVALYSTRTAESPVGTVAAFRAEELRFAHALRALSEARPPGSERLHFIGYDLDMAPGGGYDDLKGELAPAAEVPVVAELAAELRRVPGESHDAEKARLIAGNQYLVAHWGELGRALAPGAITEVAADLACLGPSLAFAWAADDPATMLGDLAYRERYMIDFVDHRLPPDALAHGLILMGHDAHLTRDEGQLVEVPSDIHWTWPRVGSHLAARLGARLLVVWLVYDRGEHSDAAQCTALPCAIDARPNELGHALATLGGRFVIPTHAPDGTADPYLDAWRTLLFHGNPVRARLAPQVDLIAFIAIVHRMVN